jgi:hypothetical protein
MTFSPDTLPDQPWKPGKQFYVQGGFCRTKERLGIPRWCSRHRGAVTGRGCLPGMSL